MTGIMQRLRPLPFRARLVMPALVCIAVTVVLVAWFPAAEIYIGAGDKAPRILGPLEYGPMLISLVLCIGLAPRFADWDRYGALNTRLLALGNFVLIVLVPLALFFALLVSPIDFIAVYEATPDELIPYASNVAVAAALTFCLIGTVGRLAGSVLWAAIIIGLTYLQAAVPRFVTLLPFTAHFDAQGGVDTRVRWVWILLLVVAGGTVAWVRRGVPAVVMTRVGDDS